MGTPLTLYQTQLVYLLSNDATELSSAAQLEMVKSAMEQYSRDKADTRAEDVTGAGTRYYALATILDQWSERFSQVTQVEYPAASIASDETPVYLEPEDWDDNYWAEASGVQTRYLRFPSHQPASTETMRITYTVPWAWSAATSTTAVAQVAHGLSVDDYIVLSGSDWVATTDARGATAQVVTVVDVDNFTYGLLQSNAPVGDFYAICNLAACHSCRAIATKYASATDTTINADSTAHSSRSAEFAARAKDFCDAYLRHMGLLTEAAPSKSGSQFVQWPVGPDWPAGRRSIFHSRGRTVVPNR